MVRFCGRFHAPWPGRGRPRDWHSAGGPALVVVTCPRLSQFQKTSPPRVVQRHGWSSVRTPGRAGTHRDRTGRPCGRPVGGGPSAGPLGPLARRLLRGGSQGPAREVGTCHWLPSGMCRHRSHFPVSRGNPEGEKGTQTNSCTGPIVTGSRDAPKCCSGLQPQWDCGGEGAKVRIGVY